MAINDAKLKLYNQMIYEQELRNAKAETMRLTSENEEQLRRRKEELDATLDESLKRRLATAQMRKQEMISNLDQENMEELLTKREEYLIDLEELVREKAREYMKTKAYEDKLCREISKFLAETDQDEMILQVREEDKELVQGCVTTAGKKVHYETLPAYQVGGFVMQDMGRTYAMEDTVTSRMEKHHYEMTKMLFQELELEEGGDSHAN